MKFSDLLSDCGLSRRDAASAFGVPPETVDHWRAEDDGVPIAVLDALTRLDRQIDATAEQTLARLAAMPGVERPDVIELGVATTDEEARSLGLPCVGAHRALLGRIVVRGTIRGHLFAIVPRGSTAASQAAVLGRA
ncbi:hypothetical protein ACP4J4_02755 [Aureimonas ureilytica]|uniref:hypothetical protein n=1 Tax=Aureimonas ureilytica TaxID=401562 RepID=UPI003CFB055D